MLPNQRGAQDAAVFEEMSYLGYPFSVSNFQLRNTNATIEESLERVEEIQHICLQTNKKLVLYISMGFGNPYGDPWNVRIVQSWVERLANAAVAILQLSDTIAGVATPESISYLFHDLIPAYPNLEFGARFHRLQLLAGKDSRCL